MEQEKDISINEYEQARLDKLSKLQELGIDPFGGRFNDVEPLAEIKSKFDPEKKDLMVKGAGRIKLHRDIGSLIFITLQDRTGTLQIGLSKKLMADDWKVAKLLDLGDIVGAEGTLGQTKTGEITIWVTKLTLLAKATLPPPSKWHGLQDVEARYRQRYVDLFSNDKVLKTFEERAAIIETIREYLRGKKFTEVETPMMQPIAGGAALYHASQYAQHGFIHADCPGVVFETTAGGGDGTGVRDQ